MLGWTPEAALTTPIPWLQLAIDGAVEWEMRRNGQTPQTARKRQSEPDPEKVQQQIKAALSGRAKSRASDPSRRKPPKNLKSNHHNS